MSARRVAVVGAGQRVLGTALPALFAAGEAFELAGVWARRPRVERAAGREVEVRPLEELGARGLAEVDLVYLCVAKDAVPGVLERLEHLGPEGVDLLIDTPVVRFRHFRHARRARAFRSAWVAEDTSALPWMDTVRAAVGAGLVGAPRAVWFDQSAYAYHAIATGRALLGARRVRRARRRRLAGRLALREIAFDRGLRATVLEPRDYSSGRFVLVGTDGSLSDHPAGFDGNLHLAALEAGERCVGFRIGDVETRLDEAEADLTTGGPGGGSVTARMEGMKRVGFLRLLRGIAEGRGAYPLVDALEDMVVDYHLEKLGRYASTPFTSPRGRLGRAAWSALTRLGG